MSSEDIFPSNMRENWYCVWSFNLQVDNLLQKLKIIQDIIFRRTISYLFAEEEKVLDFVKSSTQILWKLQFIIMKV